MRVPHPSLGAAIAAALLIKAVLLFLLWRAFFSAPQAPHMRMSSKAVAAHLMPQTTRKQHDSH